MRGTEAAGLGRWGANPMGLYKRPTVWGGSPGREVGRGGRPKFRAEMDFRGSDLQEPWRCPGGVPILHRGRAGPELVL